MEGLTHNLSTEGETEVVHHATITIIHVCSRGKNGKHTWDRPPGNPSELLSPISKVVLLAVHIAMISVVYEDQLPSATEVISDCVEGSIRGGSFRLICVPVHDDG